MRWRLGYHMAATTRGVRPRGFGHFGLGGSGAWADPDLGLSVAMTCNRMAGTPFGDQRLLKVGAAAVKGAGALTALTDEPARPRHLASPADLGETSRAQAAGD